MAGASAVIFLWVPFGLLAALDWWAVGTGRARVEALAKPATMVALLWVVWGSFFNAPLTGWGVTAAVVCGLVGDVALLPQLDRFLTGLVAFLVGHVFYVVAMAPLFWSVGGQRWLVSVVGAVVVAAAGMVPTLLRDVKLRHPSMLGPVVGYAWVILSMVAAAFATGRWVVIVGALAFAGSDRLLAEARFGTRSPSRVLVHLLYHLGQACLVAGLTP